MRRDFSIGLTALALVSFAPQGLSAQDLELAAGHEMNTPTGIELELDQAGFYGKSFDLSDDEIVAEAIADFEHHIGWPEAGKASPAVWSALREYNTRSDRSETQF